MKDNDPQRPEHDGPGRERRQTTIDLVMNAAELAARRVETRFRTRLLVWAVVAAIVASLTVALPVSLISRGDRRDAAVANARYNCALWHAGAIVMRDFIRSDAKLRRDQLALQRSQAVLVPFQKILGSKVLARLTAQSQQLDANAQNYWLTNLVPRLEALADVNCNAALDPGGPNTTTGP